MSVGILGAASFPFAIIAFVLAAKANQRIDKLEAHLKKFNVPQ